MPRDGWGRTAAALAGGRITAIVQKQEKRMSRGGQSGSVRRALTCYRVGLSRLSLVSGTKWDEMGRTRDERCLARRPLGARTSHLGIFP